MNFGLSGGTGCEMHQRAGDCVRPQCGGRRRVGRGRPVLLEAAQAARVLVSFQVQLFRVMEVACRRNQEAR